MPLQVRFGLGAALQTTVGNDLHNGDNINDIAESKSHRVWQQFQDSMNKDNYKKSYRQVNRKGQTKVWRLYAKGIFLHQAENCCKKLRVF